jgi:hypothetical protein
LELLKPPSDVETSKIAEGEGGTSRRKGRGGEGRLAREGLAELAQHVEQQLDVDLGGPPVDDRGRNAVIPR